jgi:methionine-rich copper-binding protein CopC
MQWLLLFQTFLLIIGYLMRGFAMNKFFGFLVLLPIFFLAFGTKYAYAGFGITPPYVRNTSLVRNSTYEQQILLVRGDPDAGQKAEITVDAPEIADWIQIVEGYNIPLPKGEQKVPMTVRITVPEKAEFKQYTGSIRIRTVPEDGQVTDGAVSISLGALVDIDLTVIDKEIEDFRVRKVSVAELNEGHKLAWLFFPGKVLFDLSLENTGNVDVAPSQVDLRIYEGSGKVLLEETKNIGRIKKVKPYATETITAEIPTRLPAGSYIARYRVYNGDEMKQEGDLSLSIKPAGSLQTAGFGFRGLSLAHKISVLLPVFSILIAVLYFIHVRRSRRKNRN